MAQYGDSGPRVAPSRPKGSGRRAPRVVLALVIVAAVALLISVAIAIIVLRA